MLAKKAPAGTLSRKASTATPTGVPPGSARLRPGREHLDVSRFDGPRESPGQRRRHGLAVSRELFEGGEGLGEPVWGGESNFDPSPSLAFEGVYGEPGDRLDGSVYLFVADV